jgi:crossover junction endodeoxyribonuclease RusA
MYRHVTKGPLAGRILMSEEGRQYRKAVDSVVRQARARKAWVMRLKVEIAAFPPDRRARDLDNLLKSCLDSLQHSGVFESDSQIDDLRIWRGERVPGGEISVSLSPLEGEV